MDTILTEMIDLITGSIIGIGEGIGGGLSSLAESIFLTGTGAEQSLSTMGSLILIFAGFSLAFGLTRFVLNFVSSLGARNR